MNQLKQHHIVAAVVWNGSEILCVQKPKTKYPYTSFRWEYPGGKVEQGETERKALLRELREEMDYDVSIVGLLSMVSYDYPDFSVRISFYLCIPLSQNYKLKEHIASAWVKPCFIPWVGEIVGHKSNVNMQLPWCLANYYMVVCETIVDNLPGTPFQRNVWKVLCQIPLGQVRTYGDIASAIGKPTAIRAVAHAIHCNPLPYYIPCHRVVPKHGGIGNYAFGTNVKKRLLDLEHNLLINRKKNNKI